MRSIKLFVLPLLAWVALQTQAYADNPLLAVGTQPAPVALVTTPVNRNATVKLPGNTPSFAVAANDAGMLPDDTPIAHVSLLLRRPAAREAALTSFIEEVQNPSSPIFHKWLTAAQLGADYGPAPEDVTAVTDWLTSEGFTVNVVFPSGNLIDFSGTAGLIRTAFHTELRHVRVNGQLHFTNMQDPSVPAALAPVISGVPSFNDIHPQPLDTVSSSDGATSYNMAPADFQTVYNLNPVYSTGVSGQGQTIAVLENSDLYSTSDWFTYRRAFGLTKAYPLGSITVAHPNSAEFPCTDPGVVSAEREATLDAEMATAIAPNANVIVASCQAGTDPGYLIALRNLVNGIDPPSVVSISYGESEATTGAAMNAFIYALYEQAVSEGVSIFVAAGDWGGDHFYNDRGSASIHGLSASAYASTPFNVAVGGSDFEDTYLKENGTYWSATNSAALGSALSYVPEIPWDSSCADPFQANYNGFTTAYGSNGFCNSIAATDPNSLYLTGLVGGGGPSSCATGTPAASGYVGGTCAGWPKPWWQRVTGNPTDGVRDTPDVVLFASGGAWNHGIPICFSDPADKGKNCTQGNFVIEGGTSASAPLMAAIQLLVNQKTGQSWGNPNLVYYAIAGSQFSNDSNLSCDASLGKLVNPACVFHDITQGTNEVYCLAGTPNCYAPSGNLGVLSLSTTSYMPAYSAGPGWDFASGLGSVNVANLMASWDWGVRLLSDKSAATGTGTTR